MKLQNSEVKRCNNCRRRFVVEKGFHKRANGNYRSICKYCDNETDVKREHKGKNYHLKYHSWEPDGEYTKCSRCGVVKRLKSAIRVNHWKAEYLVDKKWILVKPDCIFKP